jgi:hypothetical protein
VTSVAPGAHPAPEEVDALLDPVGGDAGVAAHVEGCERCAQVRADLARVRSLLAEQARHVPAEPADLGARIAAALAAEPPLQPSAPGWGAPAAAGAPADGHAAEGPAAAPVTDLEAHRRRRRRATTWFAAAASVAVVALGGALVLPGLVDDAGDSTSGAAEDAGVGAEPPPAAQPSVDPSDLDPGPSRGSSVQGGGGVVDVSGTDYTSASLAQQAAALLAADPGTSGGSGEGLTESDTDDALARLRALPTCLSALGFGATTEAVDLASYEGDPATVVVLDDGGTDLVVVVPAGCGAGDDRVLDSAPLP